MLKAIAKKSSIMKTIFVYLYNCTHEHNFFPASHVHLNIWVANIGARLEFGYIVRSDTKHSKQCVHACLSNEKYLCLKPLTPLIKYKTTRKIKTYFSCLSCLFIFISIAFSFSAHAIFALSVMGFSFLVSFGFFCLVVLVWLPP